MISETVHSHSSSVHAFGGGHFSAHHSGEAGNFAVHATAHLVRGRVRVRVRVRLKLGLRLRLRPMAAHLTLMAS